MNLIGKIFTLLILLLSICFFMIALMVGASHENWKELAILNKNLAEQESRKLETLEAERDQKDIALRAEQVSRSLQIAAIETQRLELQQKLVQANSKLQTETQDKEEYFSRLREAESRLAKLDSDIETLQQLKSKYVDQIANSKTEVVSLTNNRFELQGDLDRLETRQANLAERLSKLTKVLNSAELDENALTDHIPTRLDGEVTSISDDMIAVSLGTDDGLRVGFIVEIFRNDKYLGKAEITTADPNRSFGRLKRPTEARVLKGDYVTTKF